MTLYACIYAREFSAQALLRLRPELRAQPCAVLEGDPPLQFVCACNARARRMGLARGMTRVEVDTFPDVTLLRRSVAEDASARAVLLDCAAIFSPAAEDLSSGKDFLAVIDITGTERLHGPPFALAEALQARVTAAGMSASIAVAQNFYAAVCLARGLRTTRQALVVPPGEESAALATLPVSVLDFTPGFTQDHAEVFAVWGIHTLGALAALPETALVARLGQVGRRLRQLALGTHSHHFVPLESAPSYAEAIEFDAPVEQLESLLFVAGSMLDQLILRISGRALAIATITVTLGLEPAGTHTRTIRPALPVNNKQLWLKLIHLNLEAHPPGAAVLTFGLAAEPGHASKVQMGLFSPQLPDSTRLDVALARVRALVGEDAVGTPVLSDTHCSDAFRVEPFLVTNFTRRDAELSGSPLTQRQVRPPEEMFVTLEDQRPASISLHRKRYSVTRAYGPWRSGGDWWNQTLWGTEQWDIVARSTEGSLLCCCITRELLHNRWYLVALYD